MEIKGGDQVGYQGKNNELLFLEGTDLINTQNFITRHT